MLFLTFSLIAAIICVVSYLAGKKTGQVTVKTIEKVVYQDRNIVTDSTSYYADFKKEMDRLAKTDKVFPIYDTYGSEWHVVGVGREGVTIYKNDKSTNYKRHTWNWEKFIAQFPEHESWTYGYSITKMILVNESEWEKTMNDAKKFRELDAEVSPVFEELEKLVNT